MLPEKAGVSCSFDCFSCSITIDDIVYVVDCGFMKVKDFNPETGLLSLDSYPVSRANALQRKGRAGRYDSANY